MEVYIKRSVQDVEKELDFLTQQSRETIIGGSLLKKKTVQLPQLNKYDLVYHYNQPRSASVIVVSDEAHLISMNKHDYKLVCDKQIQEQIVTIQYFMKLFNGASNFTVSKFIQNLRTINFPTQTIL